MAEKKVKQYVSDNAQLMAEWNWEKNTDIIPEQLACGSSQKVWWRCEKGHEWEAAIKERSKANGTNCPYCSGNKVLAGFNDLATLFPDVAAELHPIKNGDITPATISAKSSKRIWWQCSRGHEWQISVSNRTGNKSNCPYCGGKKAWPGFNDLMTVNPALAAEWHSTKNGKLTPEMVVAGSDKSVWWCCNSGHEWKAMVKDRQHGNGCPYCSGRLVSVGETDLATVSPDIAAQWHPTKNGNTNPTDVTAGSNKIVWWMCEKGHEWKTPVHQRSKVGCPYCGNKKVLHGFNDLTTTHPKLAAQWHPSKNGTLTAAMVSYGSPIPVWWQCDKGHEWRASPNGRTNKEEHTLLNCPICSSELKTSFAEQAIFYYLNKYTEAYNRQQVHGKELDIWLPLLNVGVEHDGMYYHQDEQRDNIKKSFFAEQGIRIFTVRESKCNSTNGTVIEYDYRDSRSLSKAINTLLDLLGIIPKSPADVDADAIAIQNQYIQMTKESSLAIQHPSLAKEWHPTKNGKLTPDMFSCGSHKKVWWKGLCGHEWLGAIKHRAINGNGCPICAGKIVQKGFNDLATINPEIASMWHPTKNGTVTPEQVTPFSSHKAWWICGNGHEWYGVIASVSGGFGCPICSNHSIVVGVNDLGTTHPELVAEWHPHKNGALTPQEITYGNDKKVWWMCSEGHEWEASPNSRTNAKTGCPYCSNKKILPGYNDLSTTNPEIAQQWHPTKNPGLNPQQISSGSSKKVWWLGECGHEWEMIVHNRVIGQKCPYCSGKRVLPGFNDFATEKPDLVVEWHPDKNEIKPSEVTKGSSAKVWWRCPKGHEWQATVANRSNGSGCPVCYKQSRK